MVWCRDWSHQVDPIRRDRVRYGDEMAVLDWRETGGGLSVHLKIEDGREGFVATISQRDDMGKVLGRAAVFPVTRKAMGRADLSEKVQSTPNSPSVDLSCAARRA